MNIVAFLSLVKKYWRVWVPALLIVLGAWGGYRYAENEWKVKYSELEQQAYEVRERNLILEAKAEQITTVEVTKYVDRVRVVKERAEEIVREVPIYVTAEADSRCTIPDGFVWLHDAAASNGNIQVPDATRDPNASTSGVELSTVAETVATNYGTYHEVVEQLKALQSWVRQQEELYNKSKD